jgi:hypothetical protein
MQLASFVVLSLVAQAAPEPGSLEARAKAQALLKEGAQHYERAEFADAREKFDQAYAAFPSPKLLFNIGQASRELGRPVDAVEAFEKFLAQATDAPPEMTSEAKRSVAELLPRIGKLLIDCGISNAEITVDGKKVGLSPISDLVRVAPGNHQVTVTHEGMTPAIENVTVAAGTVQTVVLRLRALVEVPAAALPAPVIAAVPAPILDVKAAEAPKQPVADEGWWLGRKWTWVAAGSAVVLAGGAAVAGLAMKSKFDQLTKSCGSASASTTDCTAGDISALDTRKNIANVLWGVSAAAAVTAGVLFFVEGRPVAVAPMAGEVNGLVAHMRF